MLADGLSRIRAIGPMLVYAPGSDQERPAKGRARSRQQICMILLNKFGMSRSNNGSRSKKSRTTRRRPASHTTLCKAGRRNRLKMTSFWSADRLRQ
jgi:hypothetical protein